MRDEGWRKLVPAELKGLVSVPLRGKEGAGRKIPVKFRRKLATMGFRPLAG